MAIDPPYRLDPFRNIVNVHWETPTEPCEGEEGEACTNGGYGFYGSIWVSFNTTGPVYGTCRNPFTGAPVLPDPMAALLPYDGYTYFNGGAYWGWGNYAAFHFDANRMDYLATIVASELSGMLVTLATRARAFGDSIMFEEGDPPLPAVRQFDSVIAPTNVHRDCRYP